VAVEKSAGCSEVSEIRKFVAGCLATVQRSRTCVVLETKVGAKLSAVSVVCHPIWRWGNSSLEIQN